MSEVKSVTFDASHNLFERARVILRFAGLVGAERTGLDGGVAEGLQIYKDLDERAALADKPAASEKNALPYSYPKDAERYTETKT